MGYNPEMKIFMQKGAQYVELPKFLPEKMLFEILSYCYYRRGGLRCVYGGSVIINVAKQYHR